MARFEGPLFVVGMPRSGTKLLRGLLNGHPDIGIPPAETEFLPDWARRWSDWGDLSRPETFRRFYAWATRSPYFTWLSEEHGRRVGAEEWYDEIARLGRGFDLPAVFEALVRLDGAVPDGGVWGDKSPGYIAHLPLLRELFPGARAVHIVRDVRDYCLSIRRAWGKNPLRAAQRWADRVGAALDAREDWGEDLLVVRYEDLIADPEPVLRRICALVERPFDPAMLELRRPTENIGDAAGARGIKSDNAGKYRSRMDPALRERVERIAGAVLARAGYPTDFPEGAERLPPRRMFAYQLADGLNLVRGDVASRGLVGALRFRWRTFRESGSWERLR